MTGVDLKGNPDEYDYARSVYCTYNSLQRVSLMNKVDINDHNLISGTFLNEVNTRLNDLKKLTPSNSTTLPT